MPEATRRLPADRMVPILEINERREGREAVFIRPRGSARSDGVCRSSALRCLHGHDLVVLRRRVPPEMIAAHADLVAHEFIAELERVQPVARDGAVAQAYHRAPQYSLEFVLQFIERLDALGVRHPLADIEDGGRKLAGLLRRDPRDLGVD